MRKSVFVLAVLGLVGTVASRAEAQFRFGANVDYGTDTDFGIGARGLFGLGKTNLPIEGLVTFDYFFPGNSVHYWELSGNAIYKFEIKDSSIKPYAGAGLLISHTSVDYNGICGGLGVDCSASSTNAGLNLIGGLRFKGGEHFAPFVEGRLEAHSGSQFVLSAGVFFGKW